MWASHQVSGAGRQVPIGPAMPVQRHSARVPLRKAESASDSHRACRFISREIEQLDERSYALLLTAVRKSLGSCQLGDTVEARPKQFRNELCLLALSLKQL